ncbi:MAG: hydrolase [Pirellulales bacterium]
MNSSSNSLTTRSPLAMSPQDTAILVVDMQEKLLPSIQHQQMVTWNVRRLLDAASVLNVKMLATEQYPKGLGHTTPDLASFFESIPEKLSFSCCGVAGLMDATKESSIHKILLVGIETHVCVQQTALDLMADGFEVYVAVDAVGSRHGLDKQTALRRMESSGATVTTTEAAMFEWCQQAGTPEFKQISQLVRETAPTESTE